MQNISATSRILGRKTAGAGDTEECTLSRVLDFIGSAAQGDILYRDAAGWPRLAARSSGQFLQTLGAAANPQWAEIAGITLATEQATTSGTAFDFTGIPSTAQRITLIFNEISLTGTDNFLVQIGTSGGIDTASYISSSDISGTIVNATNGFIVGSANATRVLSGHMVITKANTSNLWIASHAVNCPR
jgi:hypothetical protein